jgi:hypothetical protein
LSFALRPVGHKSILEESWIGRNHCETVAKIAELDAPLMPYRSERFGNTT